jgi:transposase
MRRCALVWRHSSVITATRKEIPMAGRARAVPIRLTRKRRRKLEQIVAAATSPQRLVLRARIVLAAAAGAANAAIAGDLGCSVAVVRTWRRRFAMRGIPGLFDKPRSGRPEVHGPSVRLAVLAVATSVPPEGESQWSHAMIAAHLRERGLAISQTPRPALESRSRRSRWSSLSWAGKVAGWPRPALTWMRLAWMWQCWT